MTALVLTTIIVITFIVVFSLSATTSKDSYRNSDEPQWVESTKVSGQITGGLVLVIAVVVTILSAVIAA